MRCACQVEQLHRIFKLCGSPSEMYWNKSKLPHATMFKPQQPYKRCITETFKDFPPSSLSLIETLLALDPDERGTATAALSSEVRHFFSPFTHVYVSEQTILWTLCIIFWCSSSAQSLTLVNHQACLATLPVKRWMPS